MWLDRRLCSKERIIKNKLKLGDLGKCVCSTVETSNYVKLLLYNTVIEPIWLHGISLWDTTASNTITIIQHFQSDKYNVRNDEIHGDLNVSKVRNIVQDRSLS